MKWQRIQDTLEASGEINMMQLTSQQLEQFRSLFRSDIKSLDFSKVTYADSSCISLILSALRQHKITLKNPPPSVQLLIDLYELNAFVEAQ